MRVKTTGPLEGFSVGMDDGMEFVRLGSGNWFKWMGESLEPASIFEEDQAEASYKEVFFHRDESPLLPCPFCHHQGEPDRDVWAFNDSPPSFLPPGYAVICPCCEARGPRCSVRKDAVLNWNEREKP